MFEIPTGAMASPVESSLMTRLLEELEVHGPTARELYLTLLAIHGVAWTLATWTVLFSAGHGLGL
jgi:hypothetical protein